MTVASHEHGPIFSRHLKGLFDDIGEEHNEQAKRFRENFGSGTDESPNADSYFIGLFDTVAALRSRGWRRVLWFAIFMLLALAA
jgi:hypothetical protein